MKIGIASTHSFPIGLRGPVTKTGDVVIMDLAIALSQMGHEVSLFTPDGGYCPPGVTIYPMKCSFGKYPPSGEECELDCFNKYTDVLNSLDIFHDFSVTKIITNKLNEIGHKNNISTLMGGAWTHVYDPTNLIVWSESHRYRVLNGFTDFHETPLDGLAGSNKPPLNTDAHIVMGGIDTEYYCPTYDKKDYFLFMGRWHPARGYKFAIDIARANPDIEFVMAGEHPDRELFEYQRNCALEAVELTKELPNVRFEWLPADPDHHDAKKALYQGAKAFLYSVQFHEPFGLSQAESLACGTPVIGTNYGSVPEVIEHGVTGFVCENSVQSFTDAIYKINEINPQTCREHAVNRFDRKVMAENYLIEYNSIINGKW